MSLSRPFRGCRGVDELQDHIERYKIVGDRKHGWKVCKIFEWAALEIEEALGLVDGSQNIRDH